ncbi:MAG: diguanylate cyclase domain-containing protein, partial [Actinomycetota bacterium]
MPSWSYILLAALLAALAVGLPLAVWVRRLQSSLQHMLEKTEERESDAPLPVLQDAVPVEPFHDPLTGLPSRTLLLDRLQHAILKAEREKRRLAVMSLAVDGFQAAGEAGDRLHREVAERLRTCLRGTDTVARLGDGAFVILLEDLAAPEHAGSVAANLVAVIALPAEMGGQSLQMAAAVGIALYPEDGGDAEVLLTAADAALAAARRAGQG